MATTLDDFLIAHPVDQALIDQHKERMLNEVRAYKLRELREAAGLTQHQVADQIGVSQRQVSKLEHGDISNSKISTIRNYLEAVGGKLSLEFVLGDERIKLA